MANLRGRQLADFVIGEPLATGGSADVYAARQLSLDRDVVIKVLRAPSAARVERVEREARIACQFDHPYAAHVYAFGRESDGTMWIAMERVRGVTLGELLESRGRLPLGELLPIFEALCEVVHTAHASGLVHRDIKPANVLVIERAGRLLPKLVDFGIATAANEQLPPGDGTARAPVEELTDSATLTDSVMPLVGTPAYMAPEQWQVGPAAHAASVDIYALGMVAYRCLAGRLPFDTTSLAALGAAHATAGVPSIGHDISRAVERVVRRALAKQPTDRYDSAIEFARAFRRAAAPERSRGWAIAGAVAAVAVAAGIAALVVSRHSEPPWVPELTLLPAFDENADRPRFSPDGTHIAFSTDRERAGHFRIHVATVDGTDDRVITPPDLTASLLGWDRDGIRFVDDVNETTYRIAPTGGPVTVVASGRRAIRCGPGELARVRTTTHCTTCEQLVWRPADAPERAVATFAPGARVVTFRCSSDGVRAVYSVVKAHSVGYQPSDIWVLELASGRTTQLTFDGAFNETPVFARDGATVVFSSTRGGRANLWEIATTGGEPIQLTTGEGNDYGPDLASDGRLMYSVDSTAIPLFATTLGDGADRGGRDWRVVTSRVRLQHIAIAPAGDRVFATEFTSDGPRIVAIDLASGELAPISAGTVSAPANNREVVVATLPEGRELVAVSITDRSVRPITRLDGRVERLRVGEDGIIHAMIDRAGRLESWRVPLAGGAAEPDVIGWMFVVPGPRGRPSVWLRYDRVSGRTEGAVVAAGDHEPTLVFRASAVTGGDLDGAGTSFTYYDGAAVVRLEFATGRVERLFEPGEIGDAGVTVAPDGRTVYSTRTVGRTRRVMIENFAGRPPL